MHYFEKYKEAKMVLLKLVCQFYDFPFSKEELDKLNIRYDKDSGVFNIVHCIFHNYSPEGLYLWELLDLEKPIYSFSETYDLRDKVKNEQIDYTRDYYIEYLKLCMINIYMVENYYHMDINKDTADYIDVKYDEVLDELDGKIECCHHHYESAGEAAWNLFNLDNPYISLSELNKIKDNIKEKVLTKDFK